MDASLSTSTLGIFSVPPEIRLEIYKYLAPTRIRISSVYDYLRGSDKPWALASVSRQFRYELRHATYSRVVLHVDTGKAVKEAGEAYEVWLNGFDERFGPLIRRLAIDRLVDIEYMPDARFDSGPKTWQETWISLELEGWDSISTETIGDWEIRYRIWQWPEPEITSDRHIGAIKEVLATIDKRIGKRKVNTAVIGLGRENVRRLVAAYCGIGDGEARLDDETSVEIAEDMTGLEFENGG
ncbi:MAG: hypothetical protein Q9213_001159 [Squamulea squamosa]